MALQTNSDFFRLTDWYVCITHDRLMQHGVVCQTGDV